MTRNPQIFTDDQTRRLYANDASMYEDLPQGVCFPESAAGMQQIVERAAREGFSITARSAGTSLAGQATGDGVIMDTSRHLNRILQLDPEARRARVQPGVIRDTLNRACAPHGLLFGPDTATTNRCMMGGMIGNNSCGSFSIKHKTTREHTVSVDAVLSDGSRATFQPLTNAELEQKKQLANLEGRIYRGMTQIVEQHRDAILEAYPHPEIIRRNTGYALDKLCTMQPFDPDGRPFNLAELLCGSEGTLALTAAAELQLVPLDTHRILAVPHFSSIHRAMEATVEIVRHEPAAVELVDDIILDATKDNITQRRNRFFLQGEPRCILMVQFEGNDPDALREKAAHLQRILRDRSYSATTPVIEDPGDIDRVWALRKAGLGLLMGLGSDERTPSFCEDTAVRVRDLPAYVQEFQQLLDRYETNCVFYAHASVGELHLRPVIDISRPEGIAKMKAMAADIADLVGRFKGSLSGEHGDGRARAPYIEKVLGPDMMPLLRQVKELWDPHYRFNPGKIVRPDPIDSDLRTSSFSLQNMKVDTQFEWRREGGFGEALDLCNGAGVCRKLAESGGTMCPSYMATRREKDSTRGRANLFRQLFAGAGPEAFESAELKDALDLCLSCKACKSECPANVDMARMKAEFMQGWHERNGLEASEWFFGRAAALYPVAARWPRLANWMVQSPVGKELLYQFLNIHKDRTLPSFANQTFRAWFDGQHSLAADRPVALLVDPFTNYHDPGIGRAAVRVLQAMGCRVILADVTETGRPQLSKGMVRKARALARTNIPRLHQLVRRGIPIVGLEPSEVLTLRDEYLELCTDSLLDAAREVAAQSYQFGEFVARLAEEPGQTHSPFRGGDRPVHLHGHCHARALAGDEPALAALRAAGYLPVAMDTGCCGMAGSFGYEADKYSVSMQIGELTLFPAVRDTDTDALLCAPGFSCRHQIADGTGRRAYHPAELLDRALP